MIEAQDLSKQYGNVQALRDATFTIGDNEVVGLLGPNGAGKTTLMKILTGFLHPTAGLARIDGTDVLEQPLKVQAHIGYLPENAPLYTDMLVQEYLQMMAELREIDPADQPRLIAEAVRRTGLEAYLVRPIGELSKGYRQRVGLAQAILHQPKVLILDEPTTGLDPNQIVEIRQLIKDLAQHSTVLLSTHILPEVELTCERVLVINEGQVRADAKLSELQVSNSAVISIDGEKERVISALSGLTGVQEVKPVEGDQSLIEGFERYHVIGGDRSLCPAIFDLAKQQGWRLAELRAERQTLESVFRNIVEQTPERRQEVAA